MNDFDDSDDSDVKKKTSFCWIDFFVKEGNFR